MPIENIVEFIIYVSPGFIALKIYTEIFPRKKREQFDFIAWSVVIGIVLVNFIKWIDIVYLGNKLGTDQSGFPCLYFTLTLIAAGTLFGLLLVIQVYIRNWLAKRNKKLGFLAHHPDTIWQEINAKDNQVWALVILNENVMYLGWIKGYTFERESKDYEFLLTHAKKVNQNLEVEYEIKGIGVYLQLSNVQRIELLDGITPKES